MKITNKVLSIPPYISTTWAQVRTLFVKDSHLIICLNDSTHIPIPNLNEQDIQLIFSAHASFIESTQQKLILPPEKQTPFHLFQVAPNNPAILSQNGDNDGLGVMRFSFDNIESINSALQHNSAQAHLPDLPREVLGKIASIAKIVAPNEIQNMPKPEPHCNCPHCQIARAIHGKEEPAPAVNVEIIDEEVSTEDLSFQQWSIAQVGDKLFSVTNKLDTLEKYNVFLGEPVGCTCGQQGCEHILAVLKS